PDTQVDPVSEVLGDLSTDLLAVASPAGYLTAVNANWEKALGYSTAELTSRPYLDFIHPDDAARTTSEAQAILDPSHITVAFENRYRHIDGSYRWLSWNARATEDGREIVCIVRDITEDKQTAHALEILADALQRTENDYRLLAENATDVVLQTDADGFTVWVSPSLESVLGWKREQLLGTRPRDLVHPDDQSTRKAWRDSVVAGRIGPGVTLRIRDADNDYRWMSLFARQATDEDGQIGGLIVGLRDVNEQVQSRLALADSERRFRLLAENASDVVWELDPDFVMSWVSPSVQGVLGWTPEQLVGSAPLPLFHPDDQEALRDRGMQMLAGHDVRKAEFRIRTASGDYLWVSIQSRATMDSDGHVAGLVVGLRDVHDQVLARQALADSEHRYRLLSENATDAVFLMSPTGLITWASPATARVLGHDADSLVGISAISMIHSEDLPELHLVMTKAEHSGSTIRYDARWLTGSGEYRWMSTATGPARDDDGSVVGRITTVRDTHEKVLARQDLARSEQTFRLAMDGAPQGMAVVGLHGRLLQVNNALSTLVRRDLHWLLEHTEYDLMHPESVEGDMAARDRLLAGGAEHDTHRGRLVSSDGSVIPVLHSIALIRDEHDMPLFYVSQYQEVSDIPHADHPSDGPG
ncbi:MAG: PAS domain S-box protein, partial [Actinomycetes bacterium]